jgi:hypothetical protein
MPIHWSQVRSSLDPLKYTIRTAPAVLSKNKPWEDYDEGARSLVSAIRKVTGSSEVSLEEGAPAEKPRRGPARVPAGRERSGTRKAATLHHRKSGRSAGVLGRT